MTGALDQYKKDPKFLKTVIKITNIAEMIEEIMQELEKNFPSPENTEYDFSLKTKTLRVVKKK
jgi:hypothetical protein